MAETHKNPTPEDLELCAAGAVDFRGAKAEYGFSRSYLYELQKAGALRTVKRGRRPDPAP